MHAENDPSEILGADPAELGRAQRLDVRRAPAFAQSAHMLPGATWHDPAQIETWATGLAPGSAVVVYCVHGHEVSRNAALRLQALGLQARFLRGGISAWADAGLPLVDKPVQP